MNLEPHSFQRQNRMLTCASLGTTILGWCLFKFFYPYPNLVFDSYYYIKAAAENASISIWPIGYSRFIHYFGYISHSANALVTFQYVFQELACLFFLLTWRTIMRPGKVFTAIAFVLFFANPLLIAMANFMLSDSIFLALSLIWAALQLWLLYRPRPYMTGINIVVLLLLFPIRYNALVYPMISVIVVGLSILKRRQKIAGIALLILSVSAHIWFTSNQTAAVTGRPQYSPFGDWKLANNALYMYAHVYSSDSMTPPAEFQKLHQVVRSYFHEQQHQNDLSQYDLSFGGYYMFMNTSPLTTYMDARQQEMPASMGKKMWYRIAAFYGAYGSWLIRHHPTAYCRYFIAPNIQRYCRPSPEVFGQRVPFSLDKSYGSQIVTQWFGLDTIDVPDRNIDVFIQTLHIFPALYCMTHCLFLIGLWSFLFAGAFHAQPKWQKNVCLFIALLWLADACFSIGTAAIVLRHQLFINILEISAGFYFIRASISRLRQSRLSPSIVSTPISPSAAQKKAGAQ